ncbi:hypothetical protein HDE_07921 [Halotydeus destructor]|nr:hypothetical protein HDE_07921 [Halotydeus destructor]
MPPNRKTLSASNQATAGVGVDNLANQSNCECGRKCSVAESDRESSDDERHFEMEDSDSDASTEPDTNMTPKRRKKARNEMVKQYKIMKPKKNSQFRIDKRKLLVNGFCFNRMDIRDDRGLQWFRCASYANIPVDGHRCYVKAAILNGKLVSLDTNHKHAPHVGSTRVSEPLTNHTIDWIDAKKNRKEKVLHVSGYRFFSDSILNKGDGLMWYRCANGLSYGTKCTVKAAILEGKLVSLTGTHNHGPHVTTTRSRRDANQQEIEISDSDESEPEDTDRHASPVKRTTLGQGSECHDDVSHVCEKPSSDRKDQSTGSPVDEHDGQRFASNLNLLTKESQNLDMAKNKPLPLSVRVQVLEKELSVKEVIIKTLAEELCCANEIKSQKDERILELETELAKSKENNGKLVEKINRILVESKRSVYI